MVTNVVIIPWLTINTPCVSEYFLKHMHSGLRSGVWKTWTTCVLRESWLHFCAVSCRVFNQRTTLIVLNTIYALTHKTNYDASRLTSRKNSEFLTSALGNRISTLYRSTFLLSFNTWNIDRTKVLRSCHLVNINWVTVVWWLLIGH